MNIAMGRCTLLGSSAGSGLKSTKLAYYIVLPALILTTTTVSTPTTPLHSPFSKKRNTRSFATAMTTKVELPPVAKKVKHEMEMFGDVRVDNYYWLRDDKRTNPDVLSYLKQENDYTEFMMQGQCVKLSLCSFYVLCGILSNTFSASWNSIMTALGIARLLSRP